MIVIGFHAQQGAGKTTAVSMMGEAFLNTANAKFGLWRNELINLKSTFSKYALEMLSDAGINPHDGTDENLAKLKKLQLAISTAGEEVIHRDHWSKIWINNIMNRRADSFTTIFADDIRTKQNVEHMIKLSNQLQILNEQDRANNELLAENNALKGFFIPHQVYLITLECPREIRKQRIPESQWRDENNYTEQKIQLPKKLGSMGTYSINTGGTKEETQSQINLLVEEILNVA